MDVISYEYTKQRKEFGKHPTFSDSKLDLCSLPCAPGPSSPEAELWVTRRATTVQLDCIPSTSAHWVRCLSAVRLPLTNRRSTRSASFPHTAA